MTLDLRDRFRGCVLGAAIGDSLGYDLEFIQEPDDVLFMTRKGLDLPDPAIFTDDTQMSICVARAIIDADGDYELFMKKLCENFVAWVGTQEKGSPDRRAPGAACLAGCHALQAGMPWEKSGVVSKGTGGAMRVAPIGLYWHSNMLTCIEWARDSALPTHTDDDATASSAAAALLVLLAIHDVPVGLWAHELNMPLGGISSALTGAIKRATEAFSMGTDAIVALSDDGIGAGWVGHEAVAGALYCCMRCPNDYAAAVRMAATTVGDSDTIAGITGGIMGAKLGLPAIPAEWVQKIEGSSALLKLADDLFAVSPKMKQPGEKE